LVFQKKWYVARGASEDGWTVAYSQERKAGATAKMLPSQISQFDGAKVLITGGLGLVGSHLARLLAGAGADILLIDSLNENFGGNLFNIRDLEGRVRVNISDIRDVHGLRYLIRNCTHIFNLAGQTSHMDSMSAPFEDLEINCEAQLSLVEVCRQVNPDVRIVYASTRQIYGRPQYLPVDENHPLSPVDVNGINKIAGENYHLLYAQIYGMPATVLRLTNTYGPGMRIRDARQIFLGIWVRRAIEDQEFEVWGGDQVRDFTYVEDAARAFIAAACEPATIGRAYNIGGHSSVRLLDVAEAVVKQAGRGRYVIKSFPAERKRIDIGDYVSDDTAFRKATGWTPLVPLDHGIELTVRYYDLNKAHYV
jgi:UDP-glucose 4-epimerase